VRPFTGRCSEFLAVAGFCAVAFSLLVACSNERPGSDGDDVQRFLAGHWSDPIPPQGTPPTQFSELEASLDPAACGRCHVAQYADWRDSLHSHAMGPGIFWQFGVLGQEESNRCLRCHAPLAEQKALLAKGQGWRNAPQSAPPAYVTADLHRQGLVCAACHVRRHQRFGPPPGAAPADAPAVTPHGGFVMSTAFEDSRFCATCHQFPPQGRGLNGKLLEDTYEEWRASRAAREGRTCQKCHMPGRRHLWRGIHDPATLRSSLVRRLEVVRLSQDRARVTATFVNEGAGHFLPTYVVPKIFITLALVAGNGAQREIARRTIGRTADEALTRELEDTRIAPDGKFVVETELELPAGVSSVEMLVEVAPGEHYERMFQAMLGRRDLKLDAVGRGLLQDALHSARAKRYRLDRLVVTVPERLGTTARRVAN
jgi:hypothetical protein